MVLDGQDGLLGAVQRLVWQGFLDGQKAFLNKHQHQGLKSRISPDYS